MDTNPNPALFDHGGRNTITTRMTAAERLEWLCQRKEDAVACQDFDAAAELRDRADVLRALMKRKSQTNSREGWEKVSANQKQIDGDHYHSEIQPWDFIVANDIPFLEGNVIKYICRHRKKNGVRDLEKAKHYLEKLIEVETEKSQ